VWVKQHPERCYGTQIGRLPSQLQQLFKNKLLNQDGAFVEYWLALVLTTIPENSGNLDSSSKFVQLKKALSAIPLKSFSMGNIVSCAYVITEIATICKTEVRQNE
jgi:hypothetical protein